MKGKAVRIEFAEYIRALRIELLREYFEVSCRLDAIIAAPATEAATPKREANE